MQTSSGSVFLGTKPKSIEALGQADFSNRGTSDATLERWSADSPGPWHGAECPQLQPPPCVGLPSPQSRAAGAYFSTDQLSKLLSLLELLKQGEVHPAGLSRGLHTAEGRLGPSPLP